MLIWCVAFPVSGILITFIFKEQIKTEDKRNLKFMKKLFLTLAVALALTSCHKDEKANSNQNSGEKPDKEQAKADILALEDHYMASVNANQIDSLNHYYADDARSYMFGKPVVAGKAAILEGMKAETSKMPKDIKMSVTPTEFLIANDGKQAVEIGSYQFTGADGHSLNSGHYFGYFEKREGKFVCVREMVTADAPVKPITQ